MSFEPPTDEASALQTLADFAKTAPGRLPERVQKAIEIAAAASGDASDTDITSRIAARTNRELLRLGTDDARCEVLRKLVPCRWCGRIMGVGVHGYAETCHCTNDD